MIETNIEKLRDPFVLLENGVYYMYGSGWECYKNTSGDLSGEWEYVGIVAVDPPSFINDDRWAPEVHKYNGAYYMLTTYCSSKGGKHGCTVLKADSPEGPFVEISDGIVTPANDSSIDGTLYIDPDGNPWMIYVDEWCDNEGEIGLMSAARLSDDLTRFVSEPIPLFRADAPAWAKLGVTDGCFMYTAADGKLLMLWSNWDEGGYCVGIARSVSGRIDGDWQQDETRLYTKGGGDYDGGHAMIFNDINGKMWLSLHSPNDPVGNRKEKPVFVPIKEENGTLVREDV